MSCLGHGHPDVLAAMHAQIDKLAYAHTSFFTTEAAEQLGATAGRGRRRRALSHAYFVSGGSEAVEAALKMARQYFVETGQPQREHFIARRQSYHGNTLGALAVGGNAWRREQFAPLLIPVTHVSPCYAYRDRARTKAPTTTASAWWPSWPATIDRLGRRQRHRLRRRNRRSAPPQARCTPVPGYLRGVREL